MISTTLFLLLVAVSITASYAVTCRSCMYADSSCSANPIPTCTGEYCTFLNLSNSLGQEVIYKCSDAVKLVVENTEFTEVNKCFAGSTSVGHYMLKICNSSDFCNAECRVGNVALRLQGASSMATIRFVLAALWAFK